MSEVLSQVSPHLRNGVPHFLDLLFGTLKKKRFLMKREGFSLPLNIPLDQCVKAVLKFIGPKKGGLQSLRRIT